MVFPITDIGLWRLKGKDACFLHPLWCQWPTVEPSRSAAWIQFRLLNLDRVTCTQVRLTFWEPDQNSPNNMRSVQLYTWLMHPPLSNNLILQTIMMDVRIISYVFLSFFYKSIFQQLFFFFLCDSDISELMWIFTQLALQHWQAAAANQSSVHLP